MARTSRNSAAVTDEPTEAVETTEAVTETTEATPEVATAEAPAEGETKAADAEPDLTAFNEAIKAATEGADQTTGDVAEAFVAGVKAAYRALNGAGRKLAKKQVQADLRTSVNDRDMPKARALMLLNDQMVEGAAQKAAAAPKEPVDPTVAFVDRAAALMLGYRIFTSEVPEGVSEDWKDKVKARVEELGPQIEAYGEYLKAKANVAEGQEPPAEPEGVSDVVRAAFKVASGRGVLPKAPRTRSTGERAAFDGVRRDIKKHILEAFEGKGSGEFLTVAEIRGFKSAEYGDDSPSSGAISARLFPPSGNCTVEGITPGEKDGKKGAYKA